METWKGKLAVVTGASAGIGIAIVKSLVNHGVNVVGLARRVERVEVLTALSLDRINSKQYFPHSNVLGAGERIKRRPRKSLRSQVRRFRSIIGEERFCMDRGALRRRRYHDKQRWSLQVRRQIFPELFSIAVVYF